MGKGKRAAADEKYAPRAKMPMDERLGERGNTGGKARVVNRERGGRAAGERPVNPRNPHMTAGVTCTGCGIKNHSASQCWTLHPEMSPFAPKKETGLMARVQMKSHHNVMVLLAEQRAREKRNEQYLEEQRDAAWKKSVVDEEVTENAYMATMLTLDDELARSIRDDDLFELEDEELAAEFRHLDTPIPESVEELREMQRSADFKRDSMSPEAAVEGWFAVGKEKFLPNSNRNLTYANALAARHIVTGGEPSMAFGVAEPLASRRSKRIQKRVVAHAGSASPEVTPKGDAVRAFEGSPTPPKSPSPAPLTPDVRTPNKTRKRGKTVKFAEVDNELIRLPMTFPLQSMGVPEPGTTHLDEPPEGELPRPPAVRASSVGVPPPTSEPAFNPRGNSIYTTAPRSAKDLRLSL